MKRHRFWTVIVLLVAPVLWASEGRTGLSKDAQKVLDYLLEDWSQRMHSTSIPLAMDNLGMPANDALRLELGQHFRDNPGSARNIRSWGANNYILSNEEKRIAKYLIGTYEATQKMPDLKAAAEALKIAPQRLKARLAFLAQAGFLVPSGDGYQLTERYGRWGGPLRFNYHTISIGDQDPFDVW